MYLWSSTSSLQPPILLRSSNISGNAAIGTTEAPLLVAKIPDAEVNGKPIVQHVAAGEEFSLVVTESGRLFSWGSGTFGQVSILPNNLLPCTNRTHTHSWDWVIKATEASWCRFLNQRRAGDEASVHTANRSIPTVRVSSRTAMKRNVHPTLCSGLSYGQNVLLNTLRSHWDQFNPSSILTKCAHYQNWAAAAVVCLRRFLIRSCDR